MIRQSLPVWCMSWNQSIDIARKLIRRRPDLKSLGKVFGATRLYDEHEAAKILAAIVDHTQKNAGTSDAKGSPVQPDPSPAADAADAPPVSEPDPLTEILTRLAEDKTAYQASREWARRLLKDEDELPGSDTHA